MTDSAALFDLLSHVGNLKHLPRTGWLYAGVVQPESVAEHCFGVALLALHLGEVINQCWPTEGLNNPLDLAKVMKIALIHDLAESEVTDLPHRSAALIGRDVKHQAEKVAIESIFNELPNAEEYLNNWYDYAQKSSPEARIVKDADRLEMIFQAEVYAKRGHTNLGEFKEGHSWYFSVSKALFEEIVNRGS